MTTEWPSMSSSSSEIRSSSCSSQLVTAGMSLDSSVKSVNDVAPAEDEFLTLITYSQSMNQWINGLINQSTNEWINRSIDQSIDIDHLQHDTQSIDRSINRSIDWWIDTSLHWHAVPGTCDYDKLLPDCLSNIPMLKLIRSHLNLAVFSQTNCLTSH